MAVLHNSLSGADLHEPKGVGSALSGQVYKASGGGTGNWSYVTETLNLGSVNTNGASNYTLASIAQSARITNVVFVLYAPVTSSGSADVVVHLKLSSGATIATATFPVASSVKGSTVTVPLDTTVAAGSYLELGVSSESSNSVLCNASISMEVI